MKVEQIQKNFVALQKVFEQEARALAKLRIHVKLVVGTKSYATLDNSVIQIALNPWEAAFSWEIIKRILRFKFHHEIQHVLSTDSHEFVSGIEDCADIFKGKGAGEERAKELGKWLVNGTEDGRIENIMVIVRRGLKKLRDWYRLKEFETTEVKTGEMSDIEMALMNLHSVACRGYLCKGFAKHFAGTPVYDKVIEQLESIKKAVTSSTTRGMADRCREMAESLAELIDPAEEKELESLSEKGQEQVIVLSNKNIEGFDKGKNWKEKFNKSSKIIAILEDTDEDKAPKGDSEGESIIPDEIIDLRTKKPKSDESEASEGKSEGSSGSNSEENSEDGSGNGKSVGNSDGEEGDGSESSGSSGGDSEGEDSEDGNSAGGKSKGEKSDSSSESGSSGSSGSSSDGEESNEEGSKGKPKKSADEFIEEKVKELDESLEKSDRLQEEMVNQEKTRKLQIVREISQNGTPERDINKPDMKNIMLDVTTRQQPWKTPAYHPYPKERWNLTDAPYEVISKAMTIREDVKKALASETEQTVGGLYEGDFDVDNIANLCLGSFDCFKRESTHKDEVHFDITILKDNSGSMGGSINTRCCTAMALLEDIVKGIPGISLKIADYSDIKHGIIKDWDDNSGEFSYSWSYHENEDVDGGQIDDFSMDLFASELVARPQATNKMLLILTDGEPCVPREALNEILTRSRQAGVYIFVFFIGYDAERITRNKDRYEDMYGEGCCIAVPFDEDMMNLGDTFVELLRANVKF